MTPQWKNREMKRRRKEKRLGVVVRMCTGNFFLVRVGSKSKGEDKKKRRCIEREIERDMRSERRYVQ